MKRLAIITAMILATPAFAETPTVEQVQEQANGIIVALRQQRDANADQLAQAMAQVAKLTKDLDAAKKAAEPKKDEPHAP
jgi:hypothetical protein